MRNNAFSLIELMVVIAIVSVLAAVATPAYQTYIIRAKFIQAETFLQHQANAAIEYYVSNGVFGNAKQVGLPTEPGHDEQTPTPTSVDDYLTKYVAFLNMGSSNNSGECAWGSIGAYVSNLSGTPASPSTPSADIAMIQNVYVDVNGIMQKYCQYTYYEGGMAGNGIQKSGNYLPNCVNLTDYPDNEAGIHYVIENSCN